jgi:hypothetical protein
MTLDDFGKMALQKYADDVDQYNILVNKTKAVESRDKFQESFMETSPDLAEFNENIEKLNSALETLLSQRLIAAQPLIEPAYQAALSGVGVDPESLKELKKKIAAAAKYMTIVYGEESLKDAPKPEAMKVAGTTSGTSGGRRIRGFDVYVDGELAGQKNAQGIIKSTFTYAAKVLEVETTDLQRAFFEEAKSEDIKADDFPSMVAFELNGHNVKVMKVDDSEDSE